MFCNLFAGHGLGTAPPSQLGGGFCIARLTAITYTRTLVYARLVDLEGNPLEGIKIRLEIQDSQKVNNRIVTTEDLSIETNSLGYTEAHIITGALLKVTARSIRKTAFYVNTAGQTSINLADYCLS